MVQMDNVTGRTDDLLIVRGVNVYPSQIESVVLGFEDVAPYYRIDLRREDGLDRLELTVERDPDPGAGIEELRDRIETRLENVLLLSPDDLEIVPPGTIERTEVGKVKRVYDHR